MNTTLSLLLSALAMMTSQAYADQDPRPHDAGVNARQHRQQHRVKQGVRSGQLTQDEVKSLRDERRNIRQEEHAYKADGKLTRDERKDLQQDLNSLSKDIYNEKHDGEQRPRAGQ